MLLRARARSGEARLGGWCAKGKELGAKCWKGLAKSKIIWRNPNEYQKNLDSASGKVDFAGSRIHICQGIQQLLQDEIVSLAVSEIGLWQKEVSI